MASRRSGDSSDFALNVASAVLAFACAFFAGLMIRDRQHLEDVRLQQLRNDTAINRSIQNQMPAAEQEVTGAIDPAPPARQRPSSRSVPQAARFQVLAVVDGTAFVEIEGPRGSEIWPVSEGSVLPGAGRVLKIVRDSERWQVIASRRVISGARQ